VLGGWLVDHVSWRAIFLLNVPAAIAAAGLAMFACESRDPRQSHSDWKARLPSRSGPRRDHLGLECDSRSGFYDRTRVGARWAWALHS